MRWCTKPFPSDLEYNRNLRQCPSCPTLAGDAHEQPSITARQQAAGTELLLNPYFEVGSDIVNVNDGKISGSLPSDWADNTGVICAADHVLIILVCLMAACHTTAVAALADA
jgi:hypothetical protein